MDVIGCSSIVRDISRPILAATLSLGVPLIIVIFIIIIIIITFNPLECKGNYSSTSNNMKLVGLHWPLMGGLILVRRGGNWVGL